MKPRSHPSLRKHPMPSRAIQAAPDALASDAVAEVLELHDDAPDGLATVDEESRREMIATAAYHIAEQRGFQPGHELNDWLAAEAAIDAMLLRALVPRQRSLVT